MSDTLLFARWILPVSRLPVEHGFVRVAQGRIVEMGSVEDLPETEQQKYHAETNHQILTPGLINCHTHLELTFPASVPRGPKETMTDWLIGVLTLFGQQEMSPEAKRERCRTGALAMRQTGTTCVNDISSGGESLSVLDELGLRGVVSLEFFHPGALEDLPAENLQALVQRFTLLQRQYGEHPRLQVGLSPHSPYNVSPSAWQWVVERCRPALVHTHLAESGDETAYCQGREDSPLYRLHQFALGKRFGPEYPAPSPVQYLDQAGLLNAQLVAAHGVYTDTADRNRLAETGVRLTHCPRSNQWIQGETLAWRDWQSSGIPLGLGTDSRLSAESLDLRDEARAAMACHGWTAEEALRRITLEGARVLGLADRVGSLEVGKAADLALWKTNPVDSELAPEALLFHPATRCQQVWVEGKSFSIPVSLA